MKKTMSILILIIVPASLYYLYQSRLDTSDGVNLSKREVKLAQGILPKIDNVDEFLADDVLFKEKEREAFSIFVEGFLSYPDTTEKLSSLYGDSVFEVTSEQVFDEGMKIISSLELKRRHEVLKKGIVFTFFREVFFQSFQRIMKSGK